MALWVHWKQLVYMAWPVPSAHIAKIHLGRTSIESYPRAPKSSLALLQALRIHPLGVDSEIAYLPLPHQLRVHPPLVLREVEVPAEGYPAVATLVGLLSRVDPPVEGKRVVPDEGLTTLAAPEGLLTGVDTLVQDKVGTLAEDLATLAALVGLLASVAGLVSSQG